jgi:hypothetical protein
VLTTSKVVAKFQVIHCVDKNYFRFYFCYAMQVGELAGIAVGATVLLNILISGYELI